MPLAFRRCGRCTRRPLSARRRTYRASKNFSDSICWAGCRTTRCPSSPIACSYRSASSPAPSTAEAEAAFGKDTLARQTFYSLRLHVRLEWPGVITQFGVASANVHELAVVPALAERAIGTLVGDRNYGSLVTAVTSLGRRAHSVELLAPYRIDTVFGQLADRCAVKRVWAHDLWHPGSYLLHTALMHAMAILLNVDHANRPPPLVRLVASRLVT